MLEGLAKVYERCCLDDLEKIGVRGKKLSEVIDFMTQVKRKYLLSR